ncbi:hypothetical protein [Terracoccus sp. 273MFTsu3.1]|uniref:hypothetical protein n=1 Tax=Terracoccus sp. 273MFTsu3.1 TaxID=1172188 RepID=UPI00036CDE8B|nr:hypothetical protein [Terracoccus sp. 273MFTsu3.1]
MDPVIVTATNGGVFTLRDAKRGTDNRGVFATDIQPISEVAVVDKDGTVLHLSRWDDEPHWIADSVFRKNGFPVFSNGRGSRFTAAYTITDEALVDAINALFPGVWA